MSKGNFVDLIEEASLNAELRNQFLNEVYREGVTAEDLLKLCHQLGYDGVSLADCGKLVKLAGVGDVRTACDFDVKY